MQITLRSKADRRRDEIVTAALEVLAADGPGGLTFAAVCRTAKLSSARLISYHFQDRSGLLAAVADRVLTDLGRSVAADLARAPAGSAQVRALFEANAEFLTTHRGHAVALVALVATDAGEPARQASRANEVAVAGLITAGIAAGDLREIDSGHAAFLVLRAIEGLAVAIATDPGLPARAYAASMADIVLRGLGR